MGYVVWVAIDEDGDKDGEYSGVVHTDFTSAKNELEEAEADPGVYVAWIKEVEA